MISYAPFWDTIKQCSHTSYSLIEKHHVSSALIDKLRNNKPLNTTTVNDLCILLECDVKDIMMFVPSENDQCLYNKSIIASNKKPQLPSS